MAKSKNTLTPRSMRYLREQGHDVDKAEHWLSFGPRGGGVRKDLFGFIDIVAMNDDHLVGVQVTSRGHMSDRMKKAMDSPHFLRWCKHAKFVVHGWDKHKNRWRLEERWAK